MFYHASKALWVLAQPSNAAQRWRELDEAVRSWLGLIAYWLSGRIPTLFPAP